MRTIFSMDAVLRGTQDEYRGLQKAALTHYPPRTPWEVIEIQTATGPLSVMEFSLREILAEIANLRGNGIQPAFVPALRTFSCDLHARATQPKATTYPRWPLSAMFQPATALDVYYLADITLKDFNTGDSVTISEESLLLALGECTLARASAIQLMYHEEDPSVEPDESITSRDARGGEVVIVAEGVIASDFPADTATILRDWGAFWYATTNEGGNVYIMDTTKGEINYEKQSAQQHLKEKTEC